MATAANPSVVMTTSTTPSPPSTIDNDRRQRYKRSRAGSQARLSFAVPTTKEENDHVKERHVTDDNPCPWQCRLLELLNSSIVQRIIIALLLLDVIILFVELALDAFLPGCSIIERDAISCCYPEEGIDSNNANGNNAHRQMMSGAIRLLAGESSKAGEHHSLCVSPLVETDNPAACDEHKYPGEHIAHDVLFSLTMIILITFEIELLLMVYLLGPKKFFSQVWYVLDLFIVTVSLVLELVFAFVHDDIIQDLVGILVLFRVWRFVRIGHGLIVSTFEIQEEKIHELKHYVQEMEEIVTQCGSELPSKRPSLLKESEH